MGLSGRDCVATLLLLVHSQMLTGTLACAFHSASNSFSQSSNLFPPYNKTKKKHLFRCFLFYWRRGRDCVATLLLLVHSQMLTGTLACAFHSASNSFSQSSNLFLPYNKTKKHLFRCFSFYWRRGRDSNSGRGRPLDGFQDRCIKPLCHLSIFILLKLGVENRISKLRFDDGITKAITVPI